MPRFVLEHTTKKKTKHVTVDADRILIGRSPQAEIPLADTGVSKEHTLIERSGDGFVFVDLKSSNGTIHNGQRKDRGTLAHEDVLLVGRIRITVLLETAEKLQDDVVSEPTDARESAADPDEAELAKPLFANDEDRAPSHPDTGITKAASTRASIPARVVESHVRTRHPEYIGEGVSSRRGNDQRFRSRARSSTRLRSLPGAGPSPLVLATPPP